MTHNFGERDQYDTRPTALYQIEWKQAVFRPSKCILAGFINLHMRACQVQMPV